MRRFRFQLDRVVRVREIEHDQKLAAWQEAQRAALAAFALVETLKTQRAEAQAELAARQESGTSSLADALTYHARFDELERKIRAARQRAEVLDARARELRAPWEAARKELRAVEKLEARRRADHQAEALHRESLEQDELASARAGTERASRSRDTNPNGPRGQA